LATLAAGAAHELASPLGTIAVISKELEHELSKSDSATIVDDVRIVRSQVERCRKSLTRMAHTAGEAPGESDSWIGTAGILEETLAELPDTSRLAVQMDTSLEGSELRCPREALVQTLRVLLDNALDASKGNVVTTLSQTPSGLEFIVRDSGPGIAAPVLKRVFDPFFTTKAPGKGMGLGLYLARNVVTGMGGSLTLDSRPGSGTTARILLPLDRLRPKHELPE
jgi:two-component system sensor histidine kinase RegB